MRPAFLIHPNSKGKPAKLAVVGWLPLRHAVLKTATEKDLVSYNYEGFGMTWDAKQRLALVP